MFQDGSGGLPMHVADPKWRAAEQSGAEQQRQPPGPEAGKPRTSGADEVIDAAAPVPRLALFPALAQDGGAKVR